MRISDWSSDVCSSDLSRRPGLSGEVLLQSRRYRLPRLADADRRGRRRGLLGSVVPGMRAGDGADGGGSAALPDRHRQRAAGRDAGFEGPQIGRAHVWTPVTNAQLVCRLLLEKKKTKKTTPRLKDIT